MIISPLLAVLLTPRLWLKGLLRLIIFSRLVSTVAVEITFGVLMQPSTGL
ncbi:MAG: sugar ABC transporter permease, partial [Chloroflexi bacterium]|nr:sugar ABC transporter permease [Chloroflexota bacterium]